MNKVKRIVTLVGAGQARIGERFIHKGSGSKCSECRYYSICVGNLESGRVYKIVNVRNKILRCEVYDLDMRVVEVTEAEVPAALASKQAIKGAVLTFHPQNCDEQNCGNIMLCSPGCLKDDDRCEVIEVYESLQCPKGFQLRRVLLRRVSPSP